MEGTVKWFNPHKAYGFIAGDDGNDYFVHLKGLGRGVLIREKDRVTFDPVETDRGKQAQNVALASGPGKASSAPSEPAEDEPEAEESAGEEPEEEAEAEDEPEAESGEDPEPEEEPEDSEDF